MPDLKVNLSYGDEYIQDTSMGPLQLMFIFWGIIIPIISVIGFIGNILTIIVLFRREMKSTTIYFLRTLVVTDTGIIVGAILGLSVISITQLNPQLWRFTDVIYPYIYTPTNFIVMTLQMLNVWVTVAVSVERYIAICHPFKSVKICNKRNAYLLIGIITLSSILYNIPRCFATSSSSCGPEAANPSCRTIITTDFGKTYFYEKVYSVWLYMLLIYIVPLLLLGVLNTLLIVELMRMRRRRSVTNIQENSETNMSIVLILIVIVFIFCQTPGLVAQFVFLDPSVLLKWTCVSNTLFVLNSSVNFLIYTAVGRKFRKILLKTFQVLIKRPVTELRTSYSQNGGTELTKLTVAKGQNNDSDEISDETCNLKGCGR